jgi:hypothetical protein
MGWKFCLLNNWVLFLFAKQVKEVIIGAIKFISHEKEKIYRENT